MVLLPTNSIFLYFFMSFKAFCPVKKFSFLLNLPFFCRVYVVIIEFDFELKLMLFGNYLQGGRRCSSGRAGFSTRAASQSIYHRLQPSGRRGKVIMIYIFLVLFRATMDLFRSKWLQVSDQTLKLK